MYSPQSKPSSRGASSIPKKTTEIMKRQVVRDHKLPSESPTQKILCPVPILQKVELIKPEIKKSGRKQEVSDTSVENSPKTRLGYDGVFKKPAIVERRIASAVSNKNVNRPRNDVKRMERFDIASSGSSSTLIGKYSVSSFNTRLDATFAASTATSFSTTSASSRDVEPTLPKIGFQNPRDILHKLKYNNQRKITPISSGQSVDYRLTDKESELSETLSQIIEKEAANKFQAVRRESIKDPPVRVMPDDDMKHTDLEGLCCQVIESDDDSDEHTSMKSHVVRRQGGVSPAQSKESVISQKNNDSQRIKNRKSGGELSPDKRRSLVFSEQSSDGEKKVRNFHKVIAQLKERQKTFVKSHSGDNDLYLEKQYDSEVEPSDSLALMGTKKDEDFVLASRLAESLDNLQRFEDAYDIDSESSVSIDMLDLREKFFIDFNKELKRHIDYPDSVFKNAKDRFQNMISWLTYSADHYLSFKGAEFMKRFEEYCAKSEEFRKESENLSTDLLEFGSYCLMLITSLCNKVEELNHEDKELNINIKYITREKLQLHKLAKELYQKNEDVRTEQLELDQKLGRMNDVSKYQEGTITELREELAQLQSGYSAVDKASSKMREEVTNLSKKISCKETESRKKLLNHDKTINASEIKVATLKEQNEHLHETFTTTLFLSNSKGDELMRTSAGLQENLNKLNNELDKVDKSRSDMEKKLEESTGYIEQAESAMTTFIYKTDPMFRQPYPLSDSTPAEREMKVQTELQWTKDALGTAKRREKQRQKKEAEERTTMGDADNEIDTLRQKLMEKDQEAKESRQFNKELKKKFDDQREKMQKLQLVAVEMQAGAQLLELLAECNDLRRRVDVLASAQSELVEQVQRSEAALSSKMFEVVQRDNYKIEEGRANEAREKLARLINERRQSRGDGSEVVEIVDTELTFNTHRQLIEDMTALRSEMKQRIAEKEEKEKMTHEVEQRLHDEEHECIKLEQKSADLEFKLREQALDRMH